MTLRQEMLQAAAAARKPLGEAAERTLRFLHRQIADDGGFRGRSGHSDLYYTAFGLDGLVALGAPVPRSLPREVRARFGDGASLDFVHLACLARCLALLPPERPVREAVLDRLEAYRTPDGGYSQVPGARQGTAYGAFLAAMACEDMGAAPPRAGDLARSLRALQAADGAFANQPGARGGTTPATAAAVTLLRHLGQPVEPAVGQWLLARAHPQGGFRAAPRTPMPDLLSTATALHALALLGLPLDRVREACLDFVDSLWSGEGGFYGHWADDALDCEYAFYGLLALGHLSG
ncbi:MAG: prenyltransferase/squalene oxidase repeat-containing protein [Candidatus Brocadiia bacterium]